MSGGSRLVGVLLAAAIAFAGYSVGEGLLKLRTGDRSVTIKGLAEQDVKSDFAVWALSFRRAGNAFADVQQALSEDRAKVLAFLKTQGFADSELDAAPVQVQDVYAREYAQANAPLRYNGVGRVTVKTARVDAVAKAANQTDPLIAAGVQLTGEGEGQGLPVFQLRGVNALKSPLLKQATANAREQAVAFADDAGAMLGELKSANQGVIRITDDDGSDYDRGRTIGKRLRVVSTFVYQLD